MAKTDSLIPIERIARQIYLLRGEKVMLDSDLAALYGVETGALTREILRSQTGISSQWGGRRYPPWAFTEHGVAMLSSVLRSKRAVRVNVLIIRTFVRLRQVLAGGHLHRRGRPGPRTAFIAFGRRSGSARVAGSSATSGRCEPNAGRVLRPARSPDPWRCG